MNFKRLLGKPVSDNIYLNINDKVTKLRSKNIVPKLSVILIGNDSASKIYVNTKKKKFLQMQCSSEIYHLEDNVDQKNIIKLIHRLNSDKDTHGILIQLPLPKHFNSNKILKEINPDKDVDGFHPENLGCLLSGNPNFIPCTPYGCIEILKYYNIKVKSKHVVIVGRSNIVGKPLFALLSQKFSIGNATVTICHSHTKNLSKFTRNADILITAIGKPEFITKDMVKDDVVVLDVGINRIDDSSDRGYHIVGDVNYHDVCSKASAITPVPGGIGPMTIAMLLFNTVQSAENSSI
tara:strand:- start:130 stop:1008 length:879 start_codon:yes stop_codon:yes gene_type:complete